MEEHQNVERVKLAGEALNRGDPEPFLSFCSDDIVVHMSGKHRLSGTYQGKDALVALWQKMAEASGGTLQFKPLDVLSDDEHLMVFLRVTGQNGDRRLDATVADAYKVGPDGKWTEFWYLMNDQEAENAFFS